MAGSKEIRNKIKSVQNTRKITKAMEMVAASKMKKAQERMRASRPYVARMLAIARHLAHANPEYRHAFLIKRPEIRNVGLIVVTSDKGLCGGLNTNALRLALASIKAWQAKGIGVQVTAIGNKGLGFMHRIKANVVSQVVNVGDRPQLEKLIGPVKVQLDAYIEKRAFPWDYIYEPDAKTVLDGLLTRYIESVIYQAVNENIASEQSARMVAMKAASDNALTIIDELQLIYNKTRQAAITKELSEIVAGAAAV
jgi:F-type H+-transporting ATPase subunit gamma